MPAGHAGRVRLRPLRGRCAISPRPGEPAWPRPVRPGPVRPSGAPAPLEPPAHRALASPRRKDRLVTVIDHPTRSSGPEPDPDSAPEPEPAAAGLPVAGRE